MQRSRIFPLLKRVFSLLLLLCALVITFRTAWVVSETLIDSDTSSMLILGEKLSREGGFMSDTWAYSTELQVLDNHLIYALLFHLTSDWSLIRFLGSVIMQLLLLASFGLLCREAGISLNRFCLGGAAALLPFSVPYGRIVVYHNMYIFHIIFSVLIVAFYLGVLRHQKNGWKNWRFWLHAALLCLVSFAVGLGGVRHLMICIVPMAAAAVLSALSGERKCELRDSLPGILWPLASLAFAGIGYLINQNVFSARYSYMNFSGQSIIMGNISDLHNVLNSLLISLGFQDYHSLFSLTGLLGLGGVIAWILTLILAFRTIRCSEDASYRFLQFFLLMSHLVMFCVFFFLSDMKQMYQQYLLPVLPFVFWVIPALCSADLRKSGGAEPLPEAEKSSLPARLTSGDAPLSVHGLVSLLACLLLIANGIFYAGYFRDPGAYGSDVEYTGLDYRDTETVTAFKPIADYLKEEGFYLCYATYWNAAVITELSDGAVRSLPVMQGTRKHPLKYEQWLADQVLQDPAVLEGKRVCIVADYELAAAFENSDKIQVTELETFRGYTVYELQDPTALARDLS
ncbi:MAG: hypothetical protein K5922_10135 [Clostridiales bacterium]|nr:hypothetical protein [Clostridiales bacterium]